MVIRTTVERRYLKTAEVAELLRTTPETVRYWRHVGKGPRSFKPGRTVLYDVEDVESWLRSERERGDAGPGAA